MKKIIALFIIVVFSNCEIKVRETNAQTSDFSSIYNKEFIMVEDMQYMLLYKTHRSSQTGYAIEIVNITKDKLEVEYLKKQIEKLN